EEEGPAEERRRDDDAATHPGVVADVGHAAKPVERRARRAPQRVLLIVRLAEQPADAAAGCADAVALLVPDDLADISSVRIRAACERVAEEQARSSNSRGEG